MSNDPIISEIKQQIDDIDAKLLKVEKVSDEVKLLSEKRQLEELLKVEIIKKVMNNGRV